MKSIKVCEYSRSRSFHYDLILQDQVSGERSQDQWSSGCFLFSKVDIVYFVYAFIPNNGSFPKYRTFCFFSERLDIEFGI